MHSHIDKQEFGLRIVVSCWADHLVKLYHSRRDASEGDNVPAQLLGQLCSGWVCTASLISARSGCLIDSADAPMHRRHMPGKKRGQLVSTPSCSSTSLVMVCSGKHSPETPCRVTHHLPFALLITRFPVLFLHGQFSPSFNNTAWFIIQAQKKETAQTKAEGTIGKGRAGKCRSEI